MHRSREEVEMRCRPIINRTDIVFLVDRSSSPTAAYDMVKAAGHGDDEALAARWLGVLRRDHPDAYVELTKDTLSHATRGTAKKGTVNETVLRGRPAVPTS